MTPAFERKLRKARDIFIRELMDGCLDCRAQKSLCKVHHDVAVQSVTDPRKCEPFQVLLRLLGIAKVSHE